MKVNLLINKLNFPFLEMTKIPAGKTTSGTVLRLDALHPKESGRSGTLIPPLQETSVSTKTKTCEVVIWNTKDHGKCKCSLDEQDGRARLSTYIPTLTQITQINQNIYMDFDNPNSDLILSKTIFCLRCLHELLVENSSHGSVYMAVSYSEYWLNWVNIGILLSMLTHIKQQL